MVDLQAEGLEVSRDLGNHGHDPRVVRGEQVDRHTGSAVVAQKLGSRILVVGQVGRGLLVSGVGLGQEGGRLNGLAIEHGVDQGLLVDGLEERAANLGLIEGSLLGVEHHEGIAVAGLGLDVPASILQVLLRGGGHGLDDVDRAVDGGGDARRLILQGVPVDRVNGRGGVAVVVLVGNRADLELRDLGVLVGARADRHRLHGVRVGRGGGHHEDREALLQGGEGVLQVDGDGLVILGFDAVDEGVELREEGALRGGLAVGSHDVRSRHIGAVRELRAITQADLVFSVGHLHGITGGQGGADRVVGAIQAVQALEDLPVATHGQRGAGQGPVIGGGVGGADIQLAVAGSCAAGRTSIATAATRGQDHRGSCGQCSASCEVFTHSHVLAPHLRELGRAVLLFRSLYLFYVV